MKLKPAIEQRVFFVYLSLQWKNVVQQSAARLQELCFQYDSSDDLSAALPLFIVQNS